ncbi:MAG: patatin-like phospholipase family protein [Pseudomonadota bacterium]
MDIKRKFNVENHRVALVLQGGGALGAYQAGVYQALHEHGLTPEWIVGTSIGAINAALIAGNPPDIRLSHLKEFWGRVAHEDLMDMRKVPDPARRLNTRIATIDTLLRGVPGFFSPRPSNAFAVGLPVPPEEASFYTTDELSGTLTQLVDFPYLNAPGGIRLTVSAIKLICGSLVNFDSAQQAVGVEHVMASGALPPGFPPVRVDGELYWDGGLYSNTPLEVVLEDEPRIDTLCFIVDLWSAEGPEPTTLEQVYTRQKDVIYASRSVRHINAYQRMHRLRRIVQALHDRLPAELRDAEELQEISKMGSDTTIHIIRLAYAGRDWQMASKDINFSRGSIQWRWEMGYLDAMHAVEHTDWLSFAPDDAGVVVHDLRPAIPDQIS